MNEFYQNSISKFANEKDSKTFFTCRPSINVCEAKVTAFKPDAHTLCTVVQMVDSGKPAKIAVWRAGA